MRDYMKYYHEWLNDPFFDEQTRAELAAIESDENEIRERFYMDLEFGTAGLRGVIGAGTNRMNIYTVGKATQGLANYILKQGGADKGVAIACDSRHFSPEFSEASALVLAANGIRAYLFESLRPTPELSFAVRHLGCIAGINVTASHNPSEYNGYKVYWEDGAQITPPHDTGITQEVLAVSSYHDIKTMDRKDAEAAGLLTIIGDQVDVAYDECVKNLILHQEAIDARADDMRIVFTPLHGTGNIPVRRILKDIGFKHVTVVPEQEKPDGDFPTVPYPNPETEKAFELARALAGREDADLVLATDPDADRLGVHVRDSQGGYHPLTGNMSGCLLAEYLLSQRKEAGVLEDDSYIVRTIVSTKMADAIAQAYDTELIEVLTGFKYIGEKILESETTGKGHFQFGFEESYGSLAAGYARDKDAVAASVILCEAAAFYKQNGMTLWDVMTGMYERYGWYQEGVESVTHAGSEGLAKIAAIMEALRKDPPAGFGEWKTLAVRDYREGIRLEAGSDTEEKLTLPKSNVLYYELTDKAWVCVRPSGTEPKIKFYFGVRGGSEEESEKLLGELKKAVDGHMNHII
ncbi:MAG: phospho-sugar mutase [Lachnospiraceae bacterium]|nr:phospho-sugar mutase [Lachnospiraceae bacterium]